MHGQISSLLVCAQRDNHPPTGLLPPSPAWGWRMFSSSWCWSPTEELGVLEHFIQLVCVIKKLSPMKSGYDLTSILWFGSLMPIRDSSTESLLPRWWCYWDLTAWLTICELAHGWGHSQMGSWGGISLEEIGQQRHTVEREIWSKSPPISSLLSFPFLIS